MTSLVTLNLCINGTANLQADVEHTRRAHRKDLKLQPAKDDNLNDAGLDSSSSDIRRNHIDDPISSAAQTDADRTNAGNSDKITQRLVFLEDYGISPFKVDIAISNVGSATQIESIWLAEMLPVLEFSLWLFGFVLIQPDRMARHRRCISELFCVVCCSWDHFPLHFGGVHLRNRRAKSLPSVPGMAMRAGLASIVTPRRALARIKYVLQRLTNFFGDFSAQLRKPHLAAFVRGVASGVQLGSFAVEHWIKAQLEAHDIGGWPLVLRPFHLLSAARRRRTSTLNGRPVPSRYMLSGADLYRLPSVLARRWVLSPPGSGLVGFTLRLGLFPATFSAGCIAGLCGGLLGAAVMASGTASGWLVSKLADRSTSSQELHVELHEDISVHDRRLRPPRFFATPGTILREYVAGESDGPQLLALLDGGRLRGSDEFVAHEPSPQLPDSSAQSRFKHTILLTNRRILCVQHVAVPRRRGPMVEWSDSNTTEEHIVKWEIPLFDVVRVECAAVDVSQTSDSSAAVFEVVYLPSNRMGRMDEAAADGFVLRKQQVFCRSPGHAQKLSEHITHQLEIIHPLIYE